MVSPDNVATSKTIQQRTGKTFHVATRLLPKRVRHPTYVLYAFFRIADDVVDDPDGPPPAQQREELTRLRDAALGRRSADDPVVAAFRDLVETHDIPEREVEVFLDAMERDVDTEYYPTRAALADYLRGSSVAVAYMMLAVMADGELDAETVERARPHAKALGEAFQLTNFLRDVREDVADHDRVYLPGETLSRYGVSVDEVRRFEYSERYANAIRDELERTEALYREGVRGIQYLPADCQFAVLLSAVLYADHHRLIREHDFDTLSERRTLSTRRRVTLTARTWLHWRRTGDPVETFRAVSAIPAPEASYETRGRDEPTGVRSRVRTAAGSLRSLVGGLTE